MKQPLITVALGWRILFSDNWQRKTGFWKPIDFRPLPIMKGKDISLIIRKKGTVFRQSNYVTFKAITVKGFNCLLQPFQKKNGLTLNGLQLLMRQNKLFLWFIITVKVSVVVSASGIVAIKIRFWQSSSTQNSFPLLTTTIYFLG